MCQYSKGIADTIGNNTHAAILTTLVAHYCQLKVDFVHNLSVCLSVCVCQSLYVFICAVVSRYVTVLVELILNAGTKHCHLVAVCVSMSVSACLYLCVSVCQSVCVSRCVTMIVELTRIEGTKHGRLIAVCVSVCL